jgi:hypothetical protein
MAAVRRQATSYGARDRDKGVFPSVFFRRENGQRQKKQGAGCGVGALFF